LQTELEELLGEISTANVTPILAQWAGIYSTRVDGYEYLGPDDLGRMDAEIVQELLARRDTGIIPGARKLVTHATWYYVTLVPEEEAARLADRLVGDLPNRVMVSFSGLAGTEVPMWVHSLGPPEDGQRVAIFAANTFLAETLGLRQAEGRIIYDTFTGIRVPADALHWGAFDEASGQTPAYLFTLTLGVAERKFVEVIYTGEDFYLVRPDLVRTSDAAALREGNTIIVRATEIYDGRVFR